MPPSPSYMPWRRRLPPVIILTGLVALVALPDMARGQQPPAAAAQLEALGDAEKAQLLEYLRQGNEHFDQGHYEEAIEAFERAVALAELPQIRYRLGVAHEKLGHPAEAAAAYRRFLELAPEVHDRPRIERDIARLEELAAARAEPAPARQPLLRLTTDPPGARVYLDGKLLGTTPLEHPASPGRATLYVDASGHLPFQEKIEIRPKEGLTRHLVLEPEASSPRAGIGAAAPAAGTGDAGLVAEAPEEPGRRWTAIAISGALAAAMGASSVWLWYQADDAVAEANNFRREHPDGNEFELEGVATGARALQVATIGTGVLAAGSLAFALVQLIFPPSPDPPPPPSQPRPREEGDDEENNGTMVHVAPVLERGGASIRLRWTFD